MTEGIGAVIRAEAPVHITVLHQRLRDAWQIGRVGPRIRENIDAAIRLAGAIRVGDFVTSAGTPTASVRTPTEACTRSVEQVHDDELSHALVSLVRDAAGISHDELTTRIARLYGWTRRGPDIVSRMESLIARLRQSGALADDNDSLTASD